MIVENVSYDFLSQIKGSVCTFSDDSRLIYLVSYKKRLLQITVYDIMYNKSIMLFADSTVTQLFEQTEGFGIIASIDEFDGNQILGYFDLQINEDRIYQTQKERIAFDFDYADRQPDNLHLYENKLWFFRDKGTGPFKPYNPFIRPKMRQSSKVYHQLSYFDLSESNPKEVMVELIDFTGLIRVQWLKTTLLLYREDEMEFSILDLNNGEWSKLKNNPEIIKYGFCSEKLITFYRTRPYDCCKYYFDGNYNATFIDKSTERLQRAPLKNPIMLGDIAWTRALNYGMLDQNPQKLPKKLRYSKLF